MRTLLAACLRHYERLAQDAKTAQRRNEYERVVGVLLKIMLHTRAKTPSP